MDRIDYNQTGGFPLSTQILDAGQKAYSIHSNYGYLAGDDLVIIKGCIEVAGNQTTDGVVSINGEPLPFVGTTITDKVIIVENSDQRGFEDGSVKPVIYERYATFGTGTAEYPWTDFRRPMTLFQLEDQINLLKKATPIGLVAVWGLPEEDIPEGWVEHIPLQGLAAVGHKPGDINFGAKDAVVGTAQVTLSISEIPEHDHAISPGVIAPGTLTTPNLLSVASTTGHQIINKTGKSGGNQSHTNIQPSRIVEWIRYVGFN